MLNLSFGYCVDQNLPKDLKSRIDQSLKLAQEKGVPLFSEKKCSSDCAKKSGTSLNDFIGSYKTSEKEDPHQREERILFISHSIPISIIKDYACFAKKRGIRLVIQGMIDHSMIKTAAFVEDIGHPVEIDPPLFTKYAILEVPVFMHKKGESVSYLKGNVTLKYAFDKLDEDLNGRDSS